MAIDVRQAATIAWTHESAAIPGTIQIVRQKHQGDDAVVAATFRNSSGRLVRGMIGLHRFDDSGWMAGGGWSSGPRDVPADAIWSSSGGWGSGRQRARSCRG